MDPREDDEIETTPSEKRGISRRDFLKIMGFLPIVIPTINPKDILKGVLEENFGELPKQIKNILDLTPESTINDEGILEINERPVIVHTTKINDKNRIRTENAQPGNSNEFIGDPKGICLHWFGNTNSWEKVCAPHKSGKEYIDNGFGTVTSAAFLVGPEVVRKNSTIDDGVSIVQAEIPNKRGAWVHSAHCLPGMGKTYFEENLHNLGAIYFAKDNPTRYSLLQKMRGSEIVPIPNRTILGIEMLGINFDYTESFPSDLEIANTLSVVIALSKKYSICPAYDLYGHIELDPAKGDPGKNVMYLMKILIGLKALEKGESELAEICFKPFMPKNTKGVSSEGIKRYFDYCLDYYNGIETKDKVIKTLLKFDLYQKNLPITKVIDGKGSSQY